MKSLNSRVWLVLTVVVGVVTSLLIFNYLKGVQEVAAASQAKTSLVMVTQKVPQGTKITEDMVKVAQLPASYASPGAIKKVDATVGKMAAVDLWPNQILMDGQVVASDTGNELPYRIAAGCRAATIKVDAPSGVGGHIKPGFFVDVIMSYKLSKEESKANLVATQTQATFKANASKVENNTRVVTVIQNTKILAVGSDLWKKNGAEPAEHVTLEVTPEQAQLLALAENAGKIKLVLRPGGDKTKPKLKANDTMGLNTMFP